ncbi:MAG TPA: LLM class flavin-dependent oxidoreductase [Ktedonobacterales bacterium]
MADQTPPRMKLGVIFGLDDETGPKRFTEIRTLAEAAERIGLDSLWLADHFYYRGPDGAEQGQWEVFTFLSALAAVTSRIQLGPLVACTSFRNPALLAKMADSLDELSGGRFILGLGAGWHEPEYTMFGYPFDHRAARFEEALQVIVPLLRDGHVDFHGQYYTADHTVLRPRGPSPSGPPIWIGARLPRMLGLVARYADAWNTAWYVDPARVTVAYEQFTQACAAVGRDPAAIELTAGALVRMLAPGEAPDPEERAIKGTPEEVAAALRGFAAVGVRHLVLVLTRESPADVERLGRVVELLGQS